MTEFSESEKTKEDQRARRTAHLKNLFKQSVAKINQTIFFSKLLKKKNVEIDPLKESFANVVGVLECKLRRNRHLVNLRKAFAKDLLQRTLKAKQKKLKDILDNFGKRKKEFFCADAKKKVDRLISIGSVISELKR